MGLQPADTGDSTSGVSGGVDIRSYPVPEQQISNTMKSQNLRDLPGFPPGYLKLIERGAAPGPMSADHPQRETLISRCKAALRRIPPCEAACQAIREEMPAFLRGHRLSDNLGRLENGGAAIVGTSAGAGDFTISLIPLLKCLTAIKLADEISREGVAAVPVLWISRGEQVETSGAEADHSAEGAVPDAGRQRGESGNFLIKNLKYVLEPSSQIDIFRDPFLQILTRLVSEFGLVPADEAMVGRKLSATEVFEESRRQAGALCEREAHGPLPFESEVKESHDPGLEGEGVAAALAARLCLPEGAEVVGPEDLVRMAYLSRIFDAAGWAAPLFWPRVSATIMDKRSSRIMDKYGLELPDILQGSEALLRRFSIERSSAQVLERLEGLAGIIGSRVSALSVQTEGDPRTVGKIRDSGRRMMYQVRKLADRFRRSAGTRRGIAARQLERLCSRIGPGGELQERTFSAVEFISAYAEPALARLYGEIDVWEFKHQLIGLD